MSLFGRSEGLKVPGGCRAMNNILMDMGGRFKKSQLSQKLRSMGLKRGALSEQQVCAPSAYQLC